MPCRVVRYAIINPVTGRPSGDYLSVDGVDLDARHVSKLEFERAKRLHPENPAYHMRGMFYTGSPYADEINELVEERK